MKVYSFTCLVGGLPFKRTWPYGYKAPFSPIDVLEEYTRPARLVENSRIITKEALSDPEFVDFDPIGTLESFNTDGLRTLLKTMNIPNMKEKTLRYPGHIDIMRVMRETGFLNKNPIEIQGKKVRPLDMTTKLLFPKWKLEEGEPEFTVMRIVIQGTEKGKPKKIIVNLFDQYDPETKTSSMARTTGYACTAAARLVLEENFKRKGICPPEYIGEDVDCFKFIMGYQKERKINYIME
jgi:saccharopine dehydrogenase-like NADP-dependent oxidoreductase